MSTDTSAFNLKAITDFQPIDHHTKNHLKKVYATLTATIIFCAVGTVLHTLLNLGGLLSFLLGLGLIMYITFSKPKKENETWRLLALIGFGFIEGLSIGPMLDYAFTIDPNIIPKAFLGTCGIFISFSLSSFFASQRTLLYIGGLAGTGLLVLLILGLSNIFFHSSWIFTVELYLGLLIFSGFVMIDTQMIIWKFRALRERDYVKHALGLFLDFVNIFIRVLALLTKDKKSKD